MGGRMLNMLNVDMLGQGYAHGNQFNLGLDFTGENQKKS
jgi:hypothetical protein